MGEKNWVQRSLIKTKTKCNLNTGFVATRIRGPKIKRQNRVGNILSVV